MHKIPTPEALNLKTALEKMGLEVKTEFDDGYKHIDLCLSDSKIYIEVDGPKHLTDSAQILTDFKRDYYSHKDGYDTIRIPNEIIHVDLGGVASALGEAVAIKKDWLKSNTV